MDTQIREDGVLVIKALVMSKSVFTQLPQYDPRGTTPEMLGWVNLEGEWYIAETEGRLVRMHRSDFWDTFAVKHKGKHYTEVNQELDKYRDNLRQIFVK